MCVGGDLFLWVLFSEIELNRWVICNLLYAHEITYKSGTEIGQEQQADEKIYGEVAPIKVPGCYTIV